MNLKNITNTSGSNTSANTRDEGGDRSTNGIRECVKIALINAPPELVELQLFRSSTSSSTPHLWFHNLRPFASVNDES